LSFVIFLTSFQNALYYHTTRDGSGEEGVSEKEDDNACADGVCKL
jgi:ribonucleoside-diphosphate reductase alpha chain